MSYKKENDDEQHQKLFVRGITETTDEVQLRSYFQQYGGILDCIIMRDYNKHSRGFGFVLFTDVASVDKIIADKRDGKLIVIDDALIEINRALPKVKKITSSLSNEVFLSNKIFVGGLPYTISEEELQCYFEKFGVVVGIELIRDLETQRLRGFAFVTFEDEDSVDKCMQRRSHEICKKLCEVKRANNKSGRSRVAARHHSFDNHQAQQDQFIQSANEPSGRQELPLCEVNYLIQQAFIMGQQSVHQHNGTFGPSTSLFHGAPAAVQLQPTGNNIILEALMGRQQQRQQQQQQQPWQLQQQQTHAPIPHLQPALLPGSPALLPRRSPVLLPSSPTCALASSLPTVPAAENSNNTLTQLAQVLQSLDSNALIAQLLHSQDNNALSGLLANQQPLLANQQPLRNGLAENSISTNTVQKESNYGPMKDHQDNYGPMKDHQKRNNRPY